MIVGLRNVHVPDPLVPSSWQYLSGELTGRRREVTEAGLWKFYLFLVPYSVLDLLYVYQGMNNIFHYTYAHTYMQTTLTRVFCMGPRFNAAKPYRVNVLKLCVQMNSFSC